MNKSLIFFILLFGSLAWSQSMTEALNYCAKVTHIQQYPQDQLVTRNFKVCKAGTETAVKYWSHISRIDDLILSDLCRYTDVPSLCKKGFWAYARAVRGPSIYFQSILGLCHKEWGPAPWYLAEDACATAVENIDFLYTNNPNRIKTDPTAQVSHVATFIRGQLAFTLWAFNRAIRGKVSQAYAKTMDYCQKKYGVIRFKDRPTQESRLCFYLADALEEHPQLDNHSILSICRGERDRILPWYPNPACEAAAQVFKTPG